MNRIKYILLTVCALSNVISAAQERTKDTIDDQTVNVIKPYTPTISDAFKIKDNPKLNDSNTVKKKAIKYNIFSIPVASTFTPAKGKAATVDRAKAVKLYDNYASLGVGNYATLLGEVYLNHELSKDENVGGYFSHHSSRGGIDGLLLDDDFAVTKLNANYSKNLRDFTWRVDGGFNMQTYNWYGIQDGIISQEFAMSLDPKHTYFGFNIGGQVDFDDALVKGAGLRVRRFFDDQDAGEIRVMANTNLDIPVQDAYIETEVYIDYLNGSFDRSYFDDEQINYGNVTFGLAPSYQLTQDDLTLNLGLRLVYLNDIQGDDSKFYIYPNIEASYRIVDELLIAYGSLNGELVQNSYEQFANSNPFVSPTLIVAPTSRAFQLTAGLKGKLSNSISYTLSGNYIADKNRALFRSNTIRNGLPTAATEVYNYGNSFGIVYDNVNTFSVAGGLDVDINRNFTLGIKGEYFGYSTNNETEAWNLPDYEASLFLDYQISEKWFAGASAYLVGQRKDLLSFENSFVGNPTLEVVTLDSFVDLNAHVGYKINEQLSVFAKANNILNQDYNRWLNFPVQGVQVLAGATYQFDF